MADGDLEARRRRLHRDRGGDVVARLDDISTTRPVFVPSEERRADGAVRGDLLNAHLPLTLAVDRCNIEARVAAPSLWVRAALREVVLEPVQRRASRSLYEPIVKVAKLALIVDVAGSSLRDLMLARVLELGLPLLSRIAFPCVQNRSLPPFELLGIALLLFS